MKEEYIEARAATVVKNPCDSTRIIIVRTDNLRNIDKVKNILISDFLFFISVNI